MRSLFIVGVACLFLPLGLHSCSTVSTNRHPSGAGSSVPISKDLGQAVKDFRAYVQSSQFNTQSCGTELSAIYDTLFNTPPTQFDLDKLSSQAMDVVDALWNARLELRTRFGQLVAAGNVPNDCVVGVRKALVAARFLEEYIAVWKLNPPAYDPNHLIPAWSGQHPYVLYAPGYQPDATQNNGLPKLQSGDILISRGDAFTSAAIARVTDVEQQFSHLAFVYVDPATQKIYTIEALIEVGVIVQPLQSNLTEGNVRSALFRYKDPAVAAAAAKAMYDRATSAISAGANIPYDFHFNLQDPSEIFCAETAYRGFVDASNNSVQLPMFLSTITKTHREFLEDIGMTGTTTFAPQDIEIDPRFDQIGEWRDLMRSHETHVKDEALTMMYQWMEQYHYILQKTAVEKIEGNIAWELRRWPLFSSLLQSKFPTNMPVTMIEVEFSLNSVGQTLFDSLTAADQNQFNETKLAMTPMQMQQALEQIRISDFNQWQLHNDWEKEMRLFPDERGDSQHEEPDAPAFHQLFHPPT